MPTYKITDPTTGKVLRVTGDSPPTETELNEIFSKVNTTQPEKGSTLSKIGNIAEGALEGAASIARPINKTAGKVVGTIGGAYSKAYGAFENPENDPTLQGMTLGELAQKTGLDKPIGKVASKIGEFFKQHPRTAKNLSNAVEVANAALTAVPVAQSAKLLKSPIGQVVKEGGLSIMESNMKPKDVTSKLAARDVMAGAEKLSADIDKYKVQSTTKGFRGIAENSQAKINSEMQAADDLIKSYAAQNPTATVDIDNTFIKFMDDLDKGKINSVFGEEEKAAELADQIHKALEKRGLTGPQPIEKIPEIKNIISNYAGGLFKKGAYNVSKDALKQQVGELAYLRMKQELEAVIPEISSHNSAVHDLINVKKAASEAVKRIGNKDKVGLTDWIALIGGPSAATSLGVPAGIASAGAIPGSILLAKKALGSGRGASGMISLGNLMSAGGKVPASSLLPSTLTAYTINDIVNSNKKKQK